MKRLDQLFWRFLVINSSGDSVFLPCSYLSVTRMSANETTLNPPSAPDDSMEKTDFESTRSEMSLADHTTSHEQAGDSMAGTTKETSKHKQRGNQGVFQGEYKEYLLKRAPEYLALANRNERSPWLTGLVEDWFIKWPWHFGSEPEEFQILSSPTALQSLTPSEIKDLKERRKTVHDGVVKLGQDVGLLLLYIYAC